MKVTVDTNILIRAAMRDDIQQAAAASQLLKDAEIIAIPLPCLCEFVWVLRRVYGIGRTDIRAALQALPDAGNVAVNRPAVDAGLAMLDAGGDFADEGYSRTKTMSPTMIRPANRGCGCGGTSMVSRLPSILKRRS